MDSTKKSIRELTTACVQIQTQITRFHGRRVKHDHGLADSVTISSNDMRLLLNTIKELETLATTTMKRVEHMEEIMLTHLDHSLNNPVFPGSEDLVSNSRKTEQDELRKLESDTGTGPDRKIRGVIVHSIS